MPYGHLIPATVMTLGVCQGHSSIASFSILTSASRSPFATAELLVTCSTEMIADYYAEIEIAMIQSLLERITCIM